jgi:hypothetical protein
MADADALARRAGLRASGSAGRYGPVGEPASGSFAVGTRAAEWRAVGMLPPWRCDLSRNPILGLPRRSEPTGEPCLEELASWIAPDRNPPS